MAFKEQPYKLPHQKEQTDEERNYFVGFCGLRTIVRQWRNRAGSPKIKSTDNPMPYSPSSLG
ncbi:hypothetical protein [Methylomonas sp.]|uniref:hypothetical protein n=1 Tax=Methylomonas sp. TaxID=418 RepID=UPI0025DDBAEE|nr:hypothetical protein [Methylomonas sp.]